MENARAKGLIPEKVVISTSTDPYMSLRALADYSSLSVRTLHTFINKAPAEALPVYRITGGKLLVRRSEFDAFMARYRTTGRPSLTKAINELGLGD